MIRRCIFDGLADTGIRVTNTAVTNAETSIVQHLQPASGFNTFDIFSIDGFAVTNQIDGILIMENNDWRTDETALIDASISGENDFIPFLGSGSAILASAIFVKVTDASSLLSLTDCTVELAPSEYLVVTENVDGVYAYPAIDGGAYTVTVIAPSFDSVSKNVTVGQGELLVVNMPMGINDDTEPSPNGGGPGCHSTATTPSHASEILLLAIAVGLLLLLRLPKPKPHTH